ncbi:MAG: Vacuolar protein sorting-associated protein 17 [Lichina confinis]|nr:MAG: Vacuolar protein sorting-associated protein 17 [Lichina confinis]
MQSSDISAGAFNSSEADLRQSQSSLTEHESSSPDASTTLEPAKNSMSRNGEAASTPTYERRTAYGAPAYEGQPPQFPPESGATPQRYASASRPVNRAAAPQYKLQAKITGLERTGRKDLILRFDVHTNLPRFRTTQFRDVRRTHSEFIKLADHLISSNPEAFVPAVPTPVTAAGAGTEEDEARVKGLMQRWLNYVCSNDVLVRDDEIVLFVESDFGYSPLVRRKQPATGVRRKVIKQFAPPPDDTPELADARPIVKLFYLGTMETGQKIDKVVKARRSLGLAESDLGVKLGSMHVQETHPGLATAYRKLGKIIQMSGDFHAAQGTAEATTLGDPMQYHSTDAFIVKETLTNRHILLRELLQAEQTTRSRRAAADRLKASSSVKREKVDEAFGALDEAQMHESFLTQKTQRVTANLLQERRRWFARTSSDLRTSMREYVLRQIESERRTLATLESVRPDIRAIDASGGLSRLGREAPPAARRASLAASQGPRGDAWSGVPRRQQDGLNRSSMIASATSSTLGGLPESPEDEDGVSGGAVAGRSRASSRALDGFRDEDDEDRVDARNAASRLAASTF